MDYKAAVFIGRFQPFHNAHLEVLKHGLKIAEKVIVIIGSYNVAPNIKNPWTYEQRVQMIQASLNSQIDRERVHFIGVRDYFYNDNFWITDIQSQTSEYIEYGDTVALLGNYKDSTSYYLKMFPQWEFVPVKTNFQADATTVRDMLFTESGRWEELVPKQVAKWINKNYMEEKGWHDRGGTGYQDRIEEYSFIQEYKAKWKTAPFPPTFVTTDAVVVQSGHVLVVRRGFNPGKGLLALPGGFIRGDERIKSAALRELKEETGIRVDSLILESSIVENRVFDHPHRSLRGRTVTHAFYIKLKDGALPQVRGNDDAEKAFWMPLMDVAARGNEFYEDHAQIIQSFVSRG